MILQFGTGNFLRAFVELFVDDLGGALAQALGPVIAVQSTGRERAEAINRAGGHYHVAIQGYRGGQVVDEIQKVTSLAKALHANSEWQQVLQTAQSEALVAIVSNTTEAGLALDDRDRDRPDSGCTPHSFPAKLLACLLSRFDSDGSGLWIIPCELVEANGDRLRTLLAEQARRWDINSDAVDWIKNDCHWVNSLVDRIVPGRPKTHPLIDSDPMLISCEPFAFWAVETERNDFPFARHPAVVTAPDISGYTLRKVRILNGAHSALVCRARATGVATVRECVEDPEIGPWLEQLLFEEIVPVLEGRCDNPAAFARATLDRFRNPFLDHQLSAIALNHESKLAVRLQPTLAEYQQQSGKNPPLLSALLSS